MNSEARRAYNRAYYQANRERLLAQQKERGAVYYAENRDRVIARQLNRYQAKRDQILARQSEYQKSPAALAAKRDGARRRYAAAPEAPRMSSRISDGKRRAQMGDGDLSKSDWQFVLDEFDHRCAYCQTNEHPLTIDHLLPLSRGGAHTKSNIVPACKSCNSSKGGKTLLEFATLVPIRMRGVRSNARRPQAGSLPTEDAL